MNYASNSRVRRVEISSAEVSRCQKRFPAFRSLKQHADATRSDNEIPKQALTWLTYGSSSYRSTSAARARAPHETRRPPLSLSIDGTDRDGQTGGWALDCFMTPNTYYADRVITGVNWSRG